MRKRHPVHMYDNRIAMTERVRNYLKSLDKDILEDENNRSDWVDKKEEFQARRYAQAFRNVSFPWPGAADIVPPLIDKKMDDLKPLYANMILGQRPPVTALATDPRYQRNTPGVELWFDWLTNHGGSPNFSNELYLFIDDVLSGMGVVKHFWQYETIRLPETIRPERLPAGLRQLVVSATSEAADLDFFNSGQQTRTLSKREFRAMRPQFAVEVAQAFDLDDKIEMEKREIGRILDWFEAGAKEPITIKKRDVVVDAPRMLAIHPLDFITPPKTMDLEQSERLTHRMWMTPRLLRQRALDNKWDRQAVNAFLKAYETRKSSGERIRGRPRGGIESTFQSEEYDREGVSATAGDTIPVHHTYAWMDVDRDGIDEKVCFVYSPAQPDFVFSSYEFTSTDGTWPFADCPFEKNLRNWYSSRGVGEKLDDLERYMIISHRAKLNGMLISTAPTFKRRRGARVNLMGHHWIPGEPIDVDRMDDLDVLVIPERAPIQEREEQVLRTWAEEYIGGVDFGISDQQSLTEPRTATEIRGIQGKARHLLSMRGQLFKTAMTKVFGAFFDMQEQFGPDEVWVAVTGEDPMRITREQLQGNFLFQITATIGEQDPLIEIARKQQRIEILSRVLPFIGDNYEIDLGEAIVDLLEQDDPRLAKRIVRKRSEEEIKALQDERKRQQQLEAQVQANMPTSLEDLEERARRIQRDKQAAPHGKLQQIR